MQGQLAAFGLSIGKLLGTCPTISRTEDCWSTRSAPFPFFSDGFRVYGSEAAAFTKGHDSLLQPLEKPFTMAGFEWDTQLPYLSFHTSGRRLDFIAQ